MVSVWDKNNNSWISEVKQYEETMWNEQSQNGSGEHQINEITHVDRGYSKCKGKRGLKVGHKIPTH